MRTLGTLASIAALTLPASALHAQDENAESERTLPERVYVQLETTEGDILLELNNEKAPISVENFVRYVEDDHYDNTVFHRVIGNFMIQGGGFTTAGVQKETRDGIKNEWQNGLKNEKYTIAMARLGGQADSATSQFFINVTDNVFLDQPRDGAGYAVFGEVIAGQSVVDAIKAVRTTVKNGMRDWPIEDVVITDAAVLSKSEADELSAELNKEAERMRLEAQREAKERWTTQLAQAMETLRGKDIDVDAGAINDETENWALVLEDGDGAMPDGPADIVSVHATGWLTDGTKFWSSYDTGAPAQFGLNQVIKGWGAAVQQMKVGEKRLVVIPAENAYGAAGRQGPGGEMVIPQNAALIFEIELIDLP
ncbi:MAG: hypothetical protein Tsb0013_12320 [Phycisphaerales bacterium]